MCAGKLTTKASLFAGPLQTGYSVVAILVLAGIAACRGPRSPAGAMRCPVISQSSGQDVSPKVVFIPRRKESERASWISVVEAFDAGQMERCIELCRQNGSVRAAYKIAECYVILGRYSLAAQELSDIARVLPGERERAGQELERVIELWQGTREAGDRVPDGQGDFWLPEEKKEIMDRDEP